MKKTLERIDNSNIRTSNNYVIYIYKDGYKGTTSTFSKKRIIGSRLMKSMLNKNTREF